MQANNQAEKGSKKLINYGPCEAIEKFYLNEQMADVHFLIVNIRTGTEKLIPAHKWILAMSSPVFHAMFFGSMPEKDAVKIKDATVNVFKEFLQCFYLKEVQLSMENIQGVMLLGHKYQFNSCLNVCSAFLKENLHIDEMYSGYQLAITYEQTDLKNWCEHHISLMAKTLLKSQEFLELDWIVLNEIVKINALNCRESDLLDACSNWARNACKRKNLDPTNKENIRNQLKHVIYEIRFSQIKIEEFAAHLVEHDIFNASEFRDINRIMGGKIPTSTKFNCASRFPNPISWCDDAEIECNAIGSKSNYKALSGDASITFSSSKTLILGGFLCCPFYMTRGAHDTSVRIFHCETTEIEIISVDVVIHDEKEIKIILSTPTIIRANEKYKITLQPKGTSIIKGNTLLVKNKELSNGTVITIHEDIYSTSIFSHLYFNDISTCKF